MKVYYDKDADLNVIKGMKVAIIGMALKVMLMQTT